MLDIAKFQAIYSLMRLAHRHHKNAEL